MGKRKTSSASIKLPNSSQIENETEEMKNLNEEQESPPSQKKSKPNSTEKQDMSSHEHFNNAADNFNQNDDNNNNNVNLVSDSNGLTTKPKASLATLMSNKTITLEETFGLENIFIGISGLVRLELLFNHLYLTFFNLFRLELEKLLFVQLYLKF